MPYQHRAAVVVLSHREQKMMGEAIASVMAQTAPDVQLLVQHSKQAWPEKLNQIVNASDAAFVVILCDDDLLDSRYVATCLRFSENADLLYTDRRYFEDGTEPADGFDLRMHSVVPRVEDAYVVTIDPRTFMFGSPLPMTVMVRRRLWDDLGGYDGKLPHADTEFLYRAIAGGARVVYVPQPLFLYRQHATQLSKTTNSMTPALVAFHLKHFRDYGVMFDAAVEREGHLLDVCICPPEEREAYIAAHFAPEDVAPRSRWAA